MMKNTDQKDIQFEPGAPSTGGSIPLSEPDIGGNEWKYVKECLDTRWVSSAGPFVAKFEHELASYVGSDHAVATVNGTAALHIALIVSGIKPNDEVLVSTLTFISPANTIRYVGAWPIFIDAEPDYWQMDPIKVIDFLEEDCKMMNGNLYNKKTGRQVKAILPVHILGHPVDMDPILEIAKKYDLIVIEDATESLGGKYKGKMIGTLGDIGCFSFNGNKIITTGGGGMIVTDNEKWAKKARYLTTQAKDNPLEYIHKEIGFNYRLTNIQAAMGVAQLEQIDNKIRKKRKLAEVYIDGVKCIKGIEMMKEASWATSIFWLSTIRVDESRYGLSSRDLINKLLSRGIQVRPLWQPIHLSPAHSIESELDYSVSEELHNDCVSIPSSTNITPDAQKKVIDYLYSQVNL